MLRHCTGCDECPGYKVIYTDKDALNVDVMFFCSMCGCPSSAHSVDAAWERENKLREEEEARVREHQRRAQQQQAQQRLELDDRRIAACRTLGKYFTSARFVLGAFVAFSVRLLASLRPSDIQ